MTKKRRLPKRFVMIQLKKWLINIKIESLNKTVTKINTTMPESRSRSKFMIMKELIFRKKCSDRGESGLMNRSSLLWVNPHQISKNFTIDLQLLPQRLEMVMEMMMMVVQKKKREKKIKERKKKKERKRKEERKRKVLKMMKSLRLGLLKSFPSSRSNKKTILKIGRTEMRLIITNKSTIQRWPNKKSCLS